MTKLTEGNLKKFIKARIESYKNEDDVVSRYNDEQQFTLIILKHFIHRSPDPKPKLINTCLL